MGPLKASLGITDLIHCFDIDYESIFRLKFMGKETYHL